MALKGPFNGSPLIPRRWTLRTKRHTKDWGRVGYEDLMKKWGKSMKWAKKAKNAEKWAFLCRKRINKTFLVIGFQFLIICFRGKPINREKSWKFVDADIKNSRCCPAGEPTVACYFPYGQWVSLRSTSLRSEAKEGKQCRVFKEGIKKFMEWNDIKVINWKQLFNDNVNGNDNPKKCLRWWQKRGKFNTFYVKFAVSLLFRRWYVGSLRALDGQFKAVTWAL